MMKVRLLNNGGFGPAMNKIKFPAIVDAEFDAELRGAVNVPIAELIRVGAEKSVLHAVGLPTLTFISEEIEVIHE